jgi:hypothetical protein
MNTCSQTEASQLIILRGICSIVQRPVYLQHEASAKSCASCSSYLGIPFNGTRAFEHR